jgi:hypothetical protein
MGTVLKKNVKAAQIIAAVACFWAFSVADSRGQMPESLLGAENTPLGLNDKSSVSLEEGLIGLSPTQVITRATRELQEFKKTKNAENLRNAADVVRVNQLWVFENGTPEQVQTAMLLRAKALAQLTENEQSADAADQALAALTDAENAKPLEGQNAQDACFIRYQAHRRLGFVQPESLHLKLAFEALQRCYPEEQVGTLAWVKREGEVAHRGIELALAARAIKKIQPVFEKIKGITRKYTYDRGREKWAYAHLYNGLILAQYGMATGSLQAMDQAIVSLNMVERGTQLPEKSDLYVDYLLSRAEASLVRYGARKNTADRAIALDALTKVLPLIQDRPKSIYSDRARKINAALNKI